MRDDLVRNDLAQMLARPIAHRGLHACGTPGPVENSISAAKAAAAAGYGIECDVQLSRDGEAMVFHDEDLARLTGTRGRLDAMDAAALGQILLRDGFEHVPTLAELLTTINGRVALVIEIKSAGDGNRRLADRTLDVIAGYGGPVALESFDPGIVLHCRNRQPSRPIGLVGPPESGDEADPAVLAACDFLSWSIADLPRIAGLRPALPRTTWTVRTPEQAALAARLGTQIVFEGFRPSSGIKDAGKEGGTPPL